jgi:GTPase SAR1 family protein
MNAFGQITIPLSQLNPRLTENIIGKVHTIEFLNGRLYIGTEKGLWIVSNNDSEAIEVKNIKEEVYRIDAIGNQVIAQTEKYKKGFGKKNSNVIKNLWIVSTDGTAIKVDDIGNFNTIFDFHVIGEHFFFRTENNEELWIVDRQGKAKPVKLYERIGSTTVVGNEILVSTPKTLWLVNENGEANVLKIGLSRHLELKSENTGVGIGYGIGEGDLVYKIDLNRSVKSKLAPDSWWGKIVVSILPENWLPAEKVPVIAYFDDKESANFDEGRLLNEFRFAVMDGNVVPPVEKFSPQGVFTYEIGVGKNEVRYWIMDKYGNVAKYEKTYYGIPSQYFFVALPFVITLFILGCFALAPKVSFCQSVIMNPWLRRYFSLGSVPLLLSVFPSLRRHLLRRYSASINKDRDFAEWKERFVCPDEEFYPENFGKRIESERRLLLTGQSGIGKTSYFKRLTANYASQEKPTHPAKISPVYIPLTNYGGNSLEDLVYNQLFSYGKVTDKELAPMFLEQGGLLIFLDGVNEVQNVADRQKLSAFVEKFWTSNYICLSSQQVYPEIENIPKVELKTFSKEKVGEFIKQRVNSKEKAENVIKKLTDEDYKLYSVPRDLEFAVEILNGGAEVLPKSRTDLYKTVFSAIFAKWRKGGNAEAEDNLCKYAYTMIVERDSTFDSVDNPKFKEVTNELFEQKFLIRREKNYNFRHDLIRAFLASEYFYPRWQNLFEELDGKAIDSNWLEMLKFSCENIKDSNEVKRLVYEVLEKSMRKDLVKDLVKWLKTNQPSKCKTWEKDFYAQYGSLDFK